MHCVPTRNVNRGRERETHTERSGHALEYVFIHSSDIHKGVGRTESLLTFFQISSNVSTPSATFFRHLSISPAAGRGGNGAQRRVNYSTNCDWFGVLRRVGRLTL